MKNKSLIIGAIVLSLVVILATGTYAYWTITKSQDGANTLIGGCLNVDITEESAGINLEKTWPISDFEGMQLEGYTFTVTNECEEPQDYRIDLDRLVDSEGRKEMSNEYLATLLDYGVPVMYEELSTGETTVEDVKEKRVLAYDTVMGKSSNEHTLRLWIDEESPVSEQGSTFLSRVEINAGQGIEKYYTPEECFGFLRGRIIKYDEECGGTDVVIPYEIIPEGETEPVAVTQISNSIFKQKGLTSVEFPRSVTTIGNFAFQYNPTIEKIIFKDGLTRIGASSFDCGNQIGKLEFINLPNTLTSIGTEAFVSNNLKQVIIHDNITYIGDEAFIYNQIEKVYLGKGLTEINNRMFMNYDDESGEVREDKLLEVYIPYNIVNIGELAFGSATSKAIISTERTKDDFLANVTTVDNWYGQAKVISSDGLNIYE